MSWRRQRFSCNHLAASCCIQCTKEYSLLYQNAGPQKFGYMHSEDRFVPAYKFGTQTHLDGGVKVDLSSVK